MSSYFLKSLTFKKILLSYTLILLIPIFIFCFVLLQKASDDNRKKLADLYNTDTQRIAGAIDNKLMELRYMGDRMNQSGWVVKLRSATDVYAEEFDIIRRREISQDLSNYIAFAGILSDVAVVFPEKDLVASQDGWYGMNDYFKDYMKVGDQDLERLYFNMHNYTYFKIIKIANTKLVNNIQKCMVVVQSLELSEEPRAVLFLFINEKYLATYIKSISGPDLVSIDITSNSEKMYNQHLMDTPAGSQEWGGLLDYTVVSNASDWQYKCTYHNIYVPVKLKQLTPVLIAGMLSLIGGVCIALFLAVISYKPLYKLFNKIVKYDGAIETFGKVLPELDLLEGSFDKLINKNKIMFQRVKDYENAARSNLLLRLLKGYFEDDGLAERLLDVGLNYTDNNYFCVVLINMHQRHENNSRTTFIKGQEIVKLLLVVEKILHEADLDYKMLDVLEDDIAVILSLDESKTDRVFIDDLVHGISLNIEAVYGIKPVISMGTVERGIIGISKTFQIAKANLECIISETNRVEIPALITDSESFYYPTDWEIQLINSLKVGNLDTVTRIVDEIKLENEKRNLSPGHMVKLVSCIMETEIRVFRELNIGVETYQKEFMQIVSSRQADLIWSYIYEVSNHICDRSGYDNTSSNFKLSNELFLYINNNYTNPNLSLKSLTEIFNIPISSLSKFFKEAKGINFYDYVCRLRMEKAKELLKDAENDIGKVANMVGYENEYSFRRAFMRCEGIRPGDYLTKLSNSDSRSMQMVEDRQIGQGDYTRENSG